MTSRHHGVSLIHHYAAVPHFPESSWAFFCAWTGDWTWVERLGGNEVARSPTMPSYDECRRDAEKHGYLRTHDISFYPAEELTPGRAQSRDVY